MNMGNSQRNRGWFGIFLGIATILIGAAFVTLCCLLDLHRAWRTFALFLFWFGALVAVASWGQVRQSALFDERALTTCVGVLRHLSLRQLETAPPMGSGATEAFRHLDHER